MTEKIYVLQHDEYALDQYPIDSDILAFKNFDSAKSYAKNLLKEFLEQGNYTIDEYDDLLIYKSYHTSYPDYTRHRVMIHKVELN